MPGTSSASWPRSTMSPVRQGSSRSRTSRWRACRHRFFAPRFTHILTYATNCSRYLRGQIRMLANRVNEFTTLDARHRIYAELLRLSRPETGRPGQAVVSPPPAHAEIAARVSIRREAVARELKSLERTGLIERRRGALVLTDTRRLRQLIEQASEF